MTLLRDIQDMASDSTKHLPDLLRKTKVLARRVGSPELAEWVDYELGGYVDDMELPPYRVYKTYSDGEFVNYPRRAKLHINSALLPDNVSWREMASTVFFRNPIAYFQELLDTPRSPEEVFDVSWPHDAMAWAQQRIKFYEGWHLERAWRVVRRADHVAMLDAIRTRVLNLALDLEALNPDLGEDTERDGPTVTREQIVHIINTTIFEGGTHAVAIGSSDFEQSAQQVVIAGNLPSLHIALAALGVPTDALKELDSALDADTQATPNGGIGTMTRRWIENVAGKLGDGATKWAGGAAAGELIRQLEIPIRAFLGF